MRPGLFLIIIVYALLLVGAQAQEQAVDRIDRSSGGSLANITITKEDFREVSYRRKGSARTHTVVADSVVDVVRGGTPASLREGKAMAFSGDLKNAVGPLQLAARDERPWVKEYANYYLAEVQRKLGRADPAVQAYKAVLAAKADSRFLPRVRLGIAQTWTAAGQYAKAQGVLESFIREVDTKRLSRSWALRGKQNLGRNLEAQEKFAAASREYDSVIKESTHLESKAADPDGKTRLRVLRLRAERDKGSALIKDKKYADASRIFSRLSADRKDGLARAIGAMGMGEIDLARGNADKARVALVRVVALGFDADEEVPRALRLLAECYLQLDEKKEKGARDMAHAYIQDLLKDYPGSEEAKIARNLQQRLK